MNPDDINFEPSIEEELKLADDVSSWRDWSGHYHYQEPDHQTPSFRVKTLSGAHTDSHEDFYYYSEALQKRDELLSDGVCAVLRYIK